jgi:hypothetical protein
MYIVRQYIIYLYELGKCSCMVGGFVSDCTIFFENEWINNYHYFIGHYFALQMYRWIRKFTLQLSLYIYKIYVHCPTIYYLFVWTLERGIKASFWSVSSPLLTIWILALYSSSYNGKCSCMVGGFVNDCTIFFENEWINNYHYFIGHWKDCQKYNAH